MANTKTKNETTKETWTREKLIEAGQEYRDQYGEIPTQAHFFPAYAARSKRSDKEVLISRFRQDDCWPHAATIIKSFGNFSEYQRACGFDPVRSGGSAAQKIQRLGEMRKNRLLLEAQKKNLSN